MKKIKKKLVSGIRKIFIKPVEEGLLFIFRHVYNTKQNMIVIETEGDFWDNGRAFYEYLIENKYNEKYQIVWFVHKPEEYQKYKNVMFVSRFHYGINFKALKIIAQAKCFLFTHPWWLKNWKDDQVVINLTHSTMALKAGGKDVSQCFDYILCASEEAKKIKKVTYHASDNQMIILGSPRNDLLYNPINIKSLLPEYKDQKVFLSMTTFKQSVGNWSDSDSIDKYALNIIKTEEQLISLNDYLCENNIILINKIHHLQNLDFMDKINLTNIVYLTDSNLREKGIQLYELLGAADVLLTDYSSVFYDYLFLNRPIGFLVGDINEYTRGFCVDNPLEAMPGEKINNYDEFISFIDCSINAIDNYSEQRKELCNKVHYYKDNHSKRLLEWLENTIFITKE